MINRSRSVYSPDVAGRCKKSEDGQGGSKVTSSFILPRLERQKRRAPHPPPPLIDSQMAWRNRCQVTGSVKCSRGVNMTLLVTGSPLTGPPTCSLDLSYLWSTVQRPLLPPPNSFFFFSAILTSSLSPPCHYPTSQWSCRPLTPNPGRAQAARKFDIVASPFIGVYR